MRELWLGASSAAPLPRDARQGSGERRSDHLHDTVSRYDHAAQRLQLLLTCPVCRTEKVIHNLAYAPTFEPPVASVRALHPREGAAVNEPDRAQRGRHEIAWRAEEIRAIGPGRLDDVVARRPFRGVRAKLRAGVHDAMPRSSHRHWLRAQREAERGCSRCPRLYPPSSASTAT